MDLNLKLVISWELPSSSSKERTTLSRTRHLLAAHTLADHHESQGPPLGELLLPELQIKTCVVKVRAAHDEFCHLLDRGVLLCRMCQLVCPRLRLRQLLELCSHLICFGPDWQGQTGRLPFDIVNMPRKGASLQPREEFRQRHPCLLANGKCGRSKERRDCPAQLARLLSPCHHVDNLFPRSFQGGLFDSIRLTWMSRMAGRSIHQNGKCGARPPEASLPLSWTLPMISQWRSHQSRLTLRQDELHSGRLKKVV